MTPARRHWGASTPLAIVALLAFAVGWFTAMSTKPKPPKPLPQWQWLMLRASPVADSMVDVELYMGERRNGWVGVHVVLNEGRPTQVAVPDLLMNQALHRGMYP